MNHSCFHVKRITTSTFSCVNYCILVFFVDFEVVNLLTIQNLTVMQNMHMRMSMSLFINVSFLHCFSMIRMVTGFSCLSEFECVNDTLIYTDEAILCRGYGSCAFASIQNIKSSGSSADRETRCAARSFCQQSVSFEGSATYAGYIHGYLGLAWTKFVNTSDNLHQCNGEASCYDLGNVFIQS